MCIQLHCATQSSSCIMPRQCACVCHGPRLNSAGYFQVDNVLLNKQSLSAAICAGQGMPVDTELLFAASLLIVNRRSVDSFCAVYMHLFFLRLYTCIFMLYAFYHDIYDVFFFDDYGIRRSPS
uniref:Uncharacterized protein n=1 Tax=Aegilops tauschii subsp. strangulata TaxID=200361 RepID=A0A453P5Z2_AEGTS